MLQLQLQLQLQLHVTFFFFFILKPIQMAARSKSRVSESLLAGTAGSNAAGGISVCLL
jgi:hypothetical protein